MEPQDFLPDFSLSTEFNKACVELMKETGEVPQPAKEREVQVITEWLNLSKKDSPNFATYLYKDCCFQKVHGTWKLATRNNNYMFLDFAEKKVKNG